MASKILVHCQRCGQAFHVAAIRKDTARYCSRACYFPAQTARNCGVCDGPIPERYLSNKKVRFCSNKCAIAHKVQNKLCHPKPEIRFWKKVDQTPGHGPNGDCWLWTGLQDEDGYGRFIVDGKRVGVHKFSYQLHKGSVPKGLCVCHKCDVRHCVRIDHLWLGDSPANTADMMAKGRNRHLEGQDHPGAKLTEEQVLDILRDERMQADIAFEYGVSFATISLIKNRKIWKHLTP